MSVSWSLTAVSLEGKCHRIYHGPDGKAFSYPYALECLIKINREMKDGIFDLKNWLKAELEKKKFRYLYGVWIDQKQKAITIRGAA